VLPAPSNFSSTSPSETPQLTQTPTIEPSSALNNNGLNFTLLTFVVCIAIAVSAALLLATVKYRGRKRG
jgi:heme/copper-type cytochrome/quinol oxidase subunit 2